MTVGKEGGILYCIGEQEPLAEFWGITESKIKKERKTKPHVYSAIYPKFLCFTMPDCYLNEKVEIWTQQNKFKKKTKKKKRTKKRSSRKRSSRKKASILKQIL